MTDDTAQREDGSEDEFGVVFGCEGFACHGGHVAIAERVCGGTTLDGCFGPSFGVYTFGWNALAFDVYVEMMQVELTVAVEYVKGVDGHVGVCQVETRERE